MSRTPLPPAAMNEIFEETKDMGVLIGKGGVYGQVREDLNHHFLFMFCPLADLTLLFSHSADPYSIAI